jgi:hypothetical protein
MTTTSSTSCKNCGRTVADSRPPVGRYHGRVVRATVQHDGFGCDTGCCGHTVYGYDDRDNEVCNHFDFTHPYSDDESQYEAWARELVVGVFGPDIPLDYAESHVTDNC